MAPVATWLETNPFNTVRYIFIYTCSRIKEKKKPSLLNPWIICYQMSQQRKRRLSLKEPPRNINRIRKTNGSYNCFINKIIIISNTIKLAQLQLVAAKATCKQFKTVLPVLPMTDAIATIIAILWQCHHSNRSSVSQDERKEPINDITKFISDNAKYQKALKDLDCDCREQE